MEFARFVNTSLFLLNFLIFIGFSFPYGAKAKESPSSVTWVVSAGVTQWNQGARTVRDLDGFLLSLDSLQGVGAHAEISLKIWEIYPWASLWARGTYQNLHLSGVGQPVSGSVQTGSSQIELTQHLLGGQGVLIFDWLGTGLWGGASFGAHQAAVSKVLIDGNDTHDESRPFFFRTGIQGGWWFWAVSDFELGAAFTYGTFTNSAPQIIFSSFGLTLKGFL